MTNALLRESMCLLVVMSETKTTVAELMKCPIPTPRLEAKQRYRTAISADHHEDEGTDEEGNEAGGGRFPGGRGRGWR